MYIEPVAIAKDHKGSVKGPLGGALDYEVLSKDLGPPDPKP